LPDDNAAFLLYVEGGLSVAEIGEITGANRDRQSRLRYAVARLKESLGADAPPD
jgi:DNA-directed RNA polymerase specialized sigma24 family protein